MANKTPLGYIQLDNGEKAIFPLNDFFLSFTFNDKKNWEALRYIVNTMIEAYQKNTPNTLLEQVIGDIVVETQYKYLLDVQNTTRNQDFKIIEEKLTYVEFQNRANVDPPIPIRAVEYLGLGMGHSKGKIANQIWLLAENVESVLFGNTFGEYAMTNVKNSKVHPNSSGLLYISLPRLSKEKSPAGELALFLLGKVSDINKDISDKAVKNIAKQFQTSFDAFRSDKEVTQAMLVKERFLREGRDEGREEGRVEGREGLMTELLELAKQGIDPIEYLQSMKKNTQAPTDTLAEV